MAHYANLFVSYLIDATIELHEPFEEDGLRLLARGSLRAAKEAIRTFNAPKIG